MRQSATVSSVTALIALTSASAAFAAGNAKNVILMISDGQGFNTVNATKIYTGAPAVYEGVGFVKYGMNTSSAGARGGYVGAAYDPSKMGDPKYALSGYTDSASAATAMYTGVKNYDNEVNWSTTGSSLKTFFEYAGETGRGVGAVSSVEFSHATPAAVLSHNSSRGNYAAIANEAMNNSSLKVLMGAGHPEFNDSGAAAGTPNYSFVGGQTTWNSLKAGTMNGFSFVDSKASFQALANGTLSASKIVGVAQAATTLQQGRTGNPGPNVQVGPNFSTQNANVPTLVDMTKGALNVLGNNPSGFAVMIEGGAIDWANHANTAGRMIEEQVDFNGSVKAVVDYLDAGTHGNDWSNTLLIVTADHECGGLFGAGTYVDNNGNNKYDTGDTFVGFQKMADANTDGMPEFQYMSPNHTNALVPLYAKGAGSELFASHAIGTENLATIYGTTGFGDGHAFIDNTAVFEVMMATGVPEPVSLGLLSLLGLAAGRRVRR